MQVRPKPTLQERMSSVPQCQKDWRSDGSSVLTGKTLDQPAPLVGRGVHESLLARFELLGYVVETGGLGRTWRDACGRHEAHGRLPGPHPWHGKTRLKAAESES